MKNGALQIVLEFEKEWEQIEGEKRDVLFNYELKFALCNKTLGLLRKEVEEKGFKNEQDEIIFFKEIKLVPMKYLIFLLEVRKFEWSIPVSGVKSRRRFLENHLDRVNNFFKLHVSLLHYMRSKSTHFDKQFFTRKFLHNTVDIHVLPYYKDSIFNTSHDVLWSRIKGLKLFVGHLNTKLHASEDFQLNSKVSKSLKWTGSYAGFVELIYGCQLMGYFNNGNTETSKVIDALGNFLNVPNGNFSRTYNELKSRKSSRIKFFEEAGQKLLWRMNQEDGII